MAVRSKVAALALHRFGVGARPGELDAMAASPRSALAAQLQAPQLAVIEAPDLPSLSGAIAALAEARMEKRTARARGDDVSRKMNGSDDVDLRTALSSGDSGLVRRTVYRSEVVARLRHGATTAGGFLERLVLFWTNHFAVSVAKGPVRVLAGAMEREAIRPHVLGPFRDMLKAVEQHPAMLLYLDNQASLGPHSKAGLRNGKGLNENLAREIMELHTSGRPDRGGTKPQPVKAFAKFVTSSCE